jgi:hypothetical protein
MGLLGPPKVMKTPRDADSQSGAPRLVSASGRTSDMGVDAARESTWATGASSTELVLLFRACERPESERRRF